MKDNTAETKRGYRSPTNYTGVSFNMKFDNGSSIGACPYYLPCGGRPCEKLGTCPAHATMYLWGVPNAETVCDK